MKPSYIIVLPTKNEEASLREVATAIRNLDIPFFIVDAHSTDNTLSIAKELGIEVFQRDEFGLGYGCGIQKALRVAKEKGFEYMGMVDCDSTYPIHSFKEMEPFIKEYELIVGARGMHYIAFWHRMANYIHSITASILFSRKVKDINSGMRILKVDRFLPHLDAYNMGLVAQMSSFAYRNNISVKEVPIHYGKRKGKSKIKIWDGVVILWHIFNEKIKPTVNPK